MDSKQPSGSDRTNILKVILVFVDFNSIASVAAEGFSGFVHVSALLESCTTVPNECGFYMILRLNKNPPSFLPKGPGGHFKGIDPNVPIATLEQKWVADTMAIYIGKAGGTNGSKWSDRTLRQRLSQYMRFGKGEPVGHRGGRYIWQLQDHKDLLVCWRPIVKGVGDPSTMESALLCEFIGTYGRLPFANLRH